MLGKGDLEFLHWAGRVGLCADLGQLRICGRCGSVMRVVISHSLRDGAAFRCSNGYCATKLSVRVDSWTWDMRLTLRQIALLFAYWIDRRPVRMAVTDVRASKQTVNNYYDFFRNLAEIAYRRDLDYIYNGGFWAVVPPPHSPPLWSPNCPPQLKNFPASTNAPNQLTTTSIYFDHSCHHKFFSRTTKNECQK